MKNSANRERDMIAKSGTSSRQADQEMAQEAPAKEQSERTTKKKTQKHTDGLVSEATRIVEQAASILEDEIAAGIVAAKQVEKRYLNVDALRSNDTEQVLHRFRTDAHEVLDIVLDLVNLSVNAMSGLAKRALTIRGGATVSNSNPGDSQRSTGSVPELVIPHSLTPGESGKISMMVENDSDSATGDFMFVTGGLLTSAGDRIDAEHVSFDPSSLVIEAHDLEKVAITVHTTPNTPPGWYMGLVESNELQAKAIITVQIEEPPQSETSL